MTTHVLTLQVDDPNNVPGAKVRELVRQIIDVGQADAAESADRSDVDEVAREDAGLAAAFTLALHDGAIVTATALCSAQDAPNVAAMLIQRSQWFAVTPLPDDAYEFTVKAENATLLHQLLADVGQDIR